MSNRAFYGRSTFVGNLTREGENSPLNMLERPAARACSCSLTFSIRDLDMTAFSFLQRVSQSHELGTGLGRTITVP